MVQYGLAVTLYISEKEAPSESCQTSKTELFAKIKELFSQKAPSYMFDMVVNSPLVKYIRTEYVFIECLRITAI